MPVRLDHKILLRTQRNCGAAFRVFSPSIFSAKEPGASPWYEEAGFWKWRCHQFLGDLSERDPPVPIPNTVVKPLSPDGTAQATVWESRKSPGLSQKPSAQEGFFVGPGRRPDPGLRACLAWRRRAQRLPLFCSFGHPLSPRPVCRLAGTRGIVGARLIASANPAECF